MRRILDLFSENWQDESLFRRLTERWSWEYRLDFISDDLFLKLAQTASYLSLDPTEISEQHLQDWINTLWEMGESRKEIRLYIKVIRDYFDEGVSRGTQSRNPTLQLRLPSKGRTKPKLLQATEASIAQCDDWRHGITSLIDMCDLANLRSEGDVTHKFVLPLLRLLGYDHAQISLEKYMPIFGRRFADVAVTIAGKPRLVVEVKRPTELLDDHLQQALLYGLMPSVEYVILTNGAQCSLYRHYAECGHLDRQLFLLLWGKRSQVMRHSPQCVVPEERCIHYSVVDDLASTFPSLHAIVNACALANASRRSDAAAKRVLRSHDLDAILKREVEGRGARVVLA